MPKAAPSPQKPDAALERERWKFVSELRRFLDMPLIVLSMIWIFLIIIEFQMPLPPSLVFLTYFIWIVFIVDFLLGWLIAPKRTAYLRSNWLVGLSVVLPAFGALRIFRAARLFRFLRLVRSFNMLKLLVSLRRAMVALRKVFGRFGLGYIVIMTIFLMLVTAGGISYFEGLPYVDSLWSAALIIIMIGPEHWPDTLEGRLLSWFLAVYALTFFSYLTANIASQFIKKEKKT